MLDCQVDSLLEKERAHVFEMIPDLQTLTFSMLGTKDLWEHTKSVCAKVPPDVVLRWAALFHDIGKPVVYRTSKGSTFPNHAMIGAEIWMDNAPRFHKILDQSRIHRIEDIIKYHMVVLLYTPSWGNKAISSLKSYCDVESVVKLAKADGGDIDNLNHLLRRI